MSASILVVDEDDAIRALLVDSLGTDYWFATASTTEDAINLLQAGSFNLILSDVTTQGTSGLELCRFAKEKCPRTVMVMISAMTAIDYAIDAMRHGAFDYIIKPFDLTRVKLAVDRALRHQQALEEKHNYELALEQRVRIRTDELRAANEQLNLMVDTLHLNYRATLRGLARTLEARDVETRGHSDRVVTYALALGNRMGLAANDLISLEQGALLHDIGKVGVPDAVLLKPGALTTDEWVRMRAHVEQGLRIIDGVEFLSGARFVVGQHHEKYDGSGYPNKLRGDDIHLQARIFAVADAFDAIRSDRPYRTGQSHEIACEEILSGSGTHFDPKVVNAFMSIQKEEWEEIRRLAQDNFGDEQRIDMQQVGLFVLSLKSPYAAKLQALCA
jgi:cyclic di-GMP phosphodiesterase